MAFCAACGHELGPAARFCEECGAPVTAAASDAQRKTVTVLFCDLTGSTALGESVDPEALRALLARYFERMKGIVERHGGMVEKFIGDAVMGCSVCRWRMRTTRCGRCARRRRCGRRCRRSVCRPGSASTPVRWSPGPSSVWR